VPWRLPASADQLPVGPVRDVIATRPASRVFCEDFAWCSLFLGTRGARVFLDGRCDPYPDAVWREYRIVLDGDPRWSSVLASYRVDTVLARPDGVLDTLLAGRRGWRLLASDDRARLYVREDAMKVMAGT
jgi:hypothetical protein